MWFFPLLAVIIHLVQSELTTNDRKLPQHRTEIRWQLKDATAIISRLFEYPFPETMAQLPLHITEAGEDQLPNWLVYNQSSNTLQGIPSMQNDGYTYISVCTTWANQAEGKIADDIFVINVIYLQEGYHTPLSNISGKIVCTTQPFCEPLEATLFTSLVLDVPFARLNVQEKVNIIKTFAEFISRSPFDISLSKQRSVSVEKLKGRQVVISGGSQRNSDGEENVNNLQITWHLMCGDLPSAKELTSVMEHNIQHGVLKKMLGHSIKKWLVSREPPKKFIVRRKRNVNGLSTPRPTPSISSILPTLISVTKILTSQSSFTLISMHSIFSEVDTSLGISSYPASINPSLTVDSIKSITNTMSIATSEFHTLSTLQTTTGVSSIFSLNSLSTLTSFEQMSNTFYMSTSLKSRFSSLSFSSQDISAYFHSSSSVNLRFLPSTSVLLYSSVSFSLFSTLLPSNSLSIPLQPSEFFGASSMESSQLLISTPRLTSFSTISNRSFPSFVPEITSEFFSSSVILSPDSQSDEGTFSSSLVKSVEGKFSSSLVVFTREQSSSLFSLFFSSQAASSLYFSESTFSSSLRTSQHSSSTFVVPSPSSLSQFSPLTSLSFSSQSTVLLTFAVTSPVFTLFSSRSDLSQLMSQLSSYSDEPSLSHSSSTDVIFSPAVSTSIFRSQVLIVTATPSLSNVHFLSSSPTFSGSSGQKVSTISGLGHSGFSIYTLSTPSTPPLTSSFTKSETSLEVKSSPLSLVTYKTMISPTLEISFVVVSTTSPDIFLSTPFFSNLQTPFLSNLQTSSVLRISSTFSPLSLYPGETSFTVSETSVTSVFDFFSTSEFTSNPYTQPLDSQSLSPTMTSLPISLLPSVSLSPPFSLLPSTPLSTSKFLFSSTSLLPSMSLFPSTPQSPLTSMLPSTSLSPSTSLFPSTSLLPSLSLLPSTYLSPSTFLFPSTSLSPSLSLFLSTYSSTSASLFPSVLLSPSLSLFPSTFLSPSTSLFSSDFLPFTSLYSMISSSPNFSSPVYYVFSPSTPISSNPSMHSSVDFSFAETQRSTMAFSSSQITPSFSQKSKMFTSSFHSLVSFSSQTFMSSLDTVSLSFPAFAATSLNVLSSSLIIPLSSDAISPSSLLMSSFRETSFPSESFLFASSSSVLEVNNSGTSSFDFVDSSFHFFSTSITPSVLLASSPGFFISKSTESLVSTVFPTKITEGISPSPSSFSTTQFSPLTSLGTPTMAFASVTLSLDNTGIQITPSMKTNMSVSRSLSLEASEFVTKTSELSVSNQFSSQVQVPSKRLMSLETDLSSLFERGSTSYLRTVSQQSLYYSKLKASSVSFMTSLLIRGFYSTDLHSDSLSSVVLESSLQIRSKVTRALLTSATEMTSQSFQLSLSSAETLPPTLLSSLLMPSTTGVSKDELRTDNPFFSSQSEQQSPVISSSVVSSSVVPLPSILSSFSLSSALQYSSPAMMSLSFKSFQEFQSSIVTDFPLSKPVGISPTNQLPSTPTSSIMTSTLLPSPPSYSSDFQASSLFLNSRETKDSVVTPTPTLVQSSTFNTRASDFGSSPFFFPSTSKIESETRLIVSSKSEYTVSPSITAMLSTRVISSDSASQRSSAESDLMSSVGTSQLLPTPQSSLLSSHSFYTRFGSLSSHVSFSISSYTPTPVAQSSAIEHSSSLLTSFGGDFTSDMLQSRTSSFLTIPAVTESVLLSQSSLSSSLQTMSIVTSSLSKVVTTRIPTTTRPIPTTEGTTTDQSSTDDTTTDDTTRPTTPREPPNQAPLLINPIDHIVMNRGDVLDFIIPPDTFQDPEDGDTRNLHLQLLDLDYQPILAPSWLQLDQANQALRGVPWMESLVGRNHYLLAARDEENLVSYDAFRIDVIQVEGGYNHEYAIALDDNLKTFNDDGSKIVSFSEKLTRFFGESDAVSVNIRSLVSGSVVVTYSNNSISKSKCDLDSVELIFTKLTESDGSVSDGFLKYMLPEFKVITVEMHLYGVCVPGSSPQPMTPSSATLTSNLLLKTLLPAVIVAAAILGCFVIACFFYKKHRPGEEYLLSEEKIIFTKNRKPVMFQNELLPRKRLPKSYPVILPDDISPLKTFPESKLGSSSVRLQPHKSLGGEIEMHNVNRLASPPPYATNKHTMPVRIPTGYKLPPPYLPRSNEDVQEFKTSMF